MYGHVPPQNTEAGREAYIGRYDQIGAVNESLWRGYPVTDINSMVPCSIFIMSALPRIKTLIIGLQRSVIRWS